MKFKAAFEDQYLMNSNGFYCGLNMPEGIKSQENNGEEISNSLPPYNRRKAFLVDKYSTCPNNWMTSEGRIKSYFVAVEENQGMWLDFNKNSEHDHEVAIVISVQGINPLTGLPCKDPQLEQYIDNCPKCNVKFGPDRLCKTCGFVYPKQNYISTTGSKIGQLWLDGFRAADGVVRQYILTQDKLRGVANSLIGEDRVFAIGVSFFISKNKKEKKTEINGLLDPLGTYIKHIKHTKGFPTFSAQKSYTSNNSNMFLSTTDSYDYDNNVECCYAASASPVSLKRSISPVSVKKVEVGAGAKIDQKLGDDPNDLSFWKNEPEAIICINYCLEEEAEKIIDGGTVDLSGSKEGFLKNVVVGNK